MSDVEKALRKIYLMLKDIRDLLAEIRDGQIPEAADHQADNAAATPPPDKPRAVR